VIDHFEQTCFSSCCRHRADIYIGHLSTSQLAVRGPAAAAAAADGAARGSAPTDETWRSPADGGRGAGTDAGRVAAAGRQRVQSADTHHFSAS